MKIKKEGTNKEEQMKERQGSVRTKETISSGK
jgi:hypothetical protein